MHRLFGSKAGKPGVYDRMMRECYRGGLKSPHRSGGSERADYPKSRIDRHGRGMVLATASWRCPDSVVILPVVDLNQPLTFDARVDGRTIALLCSRTSRRGAAFARRASSQ